MSLRLERTPSIVKKQTQIVRVTQTWRPSEYHSKFIYILQTDFPPEGVEDGDFADAYMRNHMGQTAFNQRLQGLNDDDLWISTDNDELIRYYNS